MHKDLLITKAEENDGYVVRSWPGHTVLFAGNLGDALEFMRRSFESAAIEQSDPLEAGEDDA